MSEYLNLICWVRPSTMPITSSLAIFVCAISFVILGMFSTVTKAEEPITWNQKLFNPKPSADDLVLPTPCGGAMAFVTVALASESMMRDQSFTLGSPSPDNAFSEGSRTAYLSAPFSDETDNARRFFYMAKYELTVDQMAAIRGECPAKPSIKGRIPALGVNWYDAVSVAHAYTDWLIRNHADKLPKEDGQIGYIRLPTEAEWEFSARGGLAVSASEFVAQLFPMDGGVDGYVWFSSTSSANGKPRPIGLKNPNPLGIYDIIGNAEEVVLDSYRLVQFKRLHGLAGAYQVRGGGYLTDRSALRTSYRQEIPHFDEAGPTRVPTVGVRFAIGAPVITSRERLHSIRAEWDALLPQLTEGEGAEGSSNVGKDLAAQSDNPLAELDALIEGVASEEIRERLNDLSLRVRALIDGLDSQRRKAVNSLLRQGGLYESSLVQDADIIARFDKVIGILKNSSIGAGKLRKAISAQDGRRREYTESIKIYADLIVSTAEAFDIGIIDSQRDALSVELKERKIGDRVENVYSFVIELKKYKSSGVIDSDRLSEKFESKN